MSFVKKLLAEKKRILKRSDERLRMEKHKNKPKHKKEMSKCALKCATFFFFSFFELPRFIVSDKQALFAHEEMRYK